MVLSPGSASQDQNQALRSAARLQKLTDVHFVDLISPGPQLRPNHRAVCVHYHVSVYNDGIAGEASGLLLRDRNRIGKAICNQRPSTWRERPWIVEDGVVRKWTRTGVQVIKPGVGQLQGQNFLLQQPANALHRLPVGPKPVACQDQLTNGKQVALSSNRKPEGSRTTRYPFDSNQACQWRSSRALSG